MKLLILIQLFVICFSLIVNGHENKVSSSLNGFSIDLFKQLKSDNENLFFSPLSIDLALMIAYEGAAGQTKLEFEKVLHFVNKEDFSSQTLKFIDDLTKSKDNSNFLKISNALWIKEKYKIEKDYINKIQNNYSSEINSIDFSNKQKAANKVNDWVSKNTNDLIKEIISSSDINENTRLIISNAIYFIGEWADKFDKKLTKEDYFYSMDREKNKVKFMKKTQYLVSVKK